MPTQGRALGLPSMLLMGLAAAAILVGVLVRLKPTSPLTGPAQLPAATRPAATRPDSSANPAPPPPGDFLDLVRAQHPDYPTTRPLRQVLSPKFAGQFLIPEPVLLDLHRGVLFITRPDAPETPALLATDDLGRRRVIFTRERPVFVHWGLGDDRDWRLFLVVPAPDGAPDRFVLVDRAGRTPLPAAASGYDWRRAFSINDQVIVPTRAGASVYTISARDRDDAAGIGNAAGRPVAESVSPPLVEPGDAAHGPVQLQLDNRGVLAWIPPDPASKHPGSRGAVRYVEGTWTRLAEAPAWPTGILHILPLADGSAIQFLAAPDEPDGGARLQMVNLDPLSLDRRKVTRLILELSDPDKSIRDRAYKELSTYGPSIFPIAEQMLDGEPVEAQARLRALLKAKVEPLLGGMQVVGGKLRVIGRPADGRLPAHAALLYAPDGVELPHAEEDEPPVVKPAVLNVGRGPVVSLLRPELFFATPPDKCRLDPYVGEEWLVADEAHGLRFSLAGALYPLLREEHKAFTRVVGIDAAGRLLLRRPGDKDGEGPTLVVDPSLPDPSPRLPAWTTRANTTGWTNDGWAVHRTDAITGALGASGWRALDREKDQVFTSAEEVPAVPPYVRPGPASAPSTLPATTRAAAAVLTDEEAARPLLRDAEGNVYFGGLTALKVARPDGTIESWDLPDAAQGRDGYRPWLVRAGSQRRLFLFNQPGRVLRLKLNAPSDAGPPFAIEATFAAGIPSTPDPTRIWTDPAGRICIVHDGSALTVLFPDGYVPDAMVKLIPEEELETGM